MDIYVKLYKKADISDKKNIFLKDVAEIVCDKKLENQLKNLQLLTIKEDKKSNYLISIIDIVKAISCKHPDICINSIGEMETLIDYKPEKNNKNIFMYLKIFFVSVILLAGSSSAIMSFHSDSELYVVFQNYYKIFFGVDTKNPWIIDISYSVGLAVGIIVFFNHFAGKKITDDPTPIEVELSTYEDDVTHTIIDILNEKRNKGGKNGTG